VSLIQKRLRNIIDLLKTEKCVTSKIKYDTVYTKEELEELHKQQEADFEQSDDFSEELWDRVRDKYPHVSAICRGYNVYPIESWYDYGDKLVKYLDEVLFDGRVIFEYNNEYSIEYINPIFVDTFAAFALLMIGSGDHHHVFLEAGRVEKMADDEHTEEYSVVHLFAGS
jgi:hypothetical protein